MNRYSFDKKKEDNDGKNIEESVDKAIEHADKLRKLDEHNPLEQAMKFDELRKNPPKKDFMKVECFEREDAKGNKYIESKSTQLDGTEKIIKHHPFFSIDLHDAIMAQVNACPANVGPMLLDQGMKLADLEKHTFKPEKRRDENKMMVILMIVMVTIMVGAGAFAIMMFL